jgi:EmrB/QacA subfamily drug resistance transporter
MTRFTGAPLRAAANRASSRMAIARRWQVLTVVALGNFLGWLDVTVVNIAFPSIEHSFPGASLGAVSWVLNAYSVVFAALLIAAGRLADLLGRRRLFLAGLIVFMGGSALCAAAVSLPTLIAARVLQAAGAAMVVPSSLALLLPEFAISERATAVGLWGASAGIAAAAGPALGGMLIDWQGWPAVFLINLPIGALALIAGGRILRETRAPQPPAVPDFAGASMLAGAVALVALALVQSPVWGWTGAPTVVAVAGAGILVALFLRRSAAHPAPVIPLSLLRIRSFTLANLGSLTFSSAFFAWLLCDVVYLVYAWHYSILLAGLALTPAPIFAAVGAVVSGRVADRYGQRVLAVPAVALFALGAALFAATASTHPDFLRVWLPGSVASGVGVGVGLTTFASAAAASLPAHALGVGAAVNVTARQIGAVLGVAIVVAIIGTPASIGDVSVFERSWLFSILAAVAAGVVALCLGHVRLADPARESGTAGSGSWPPARAVPARPSARRRDEISRRATPAPDRAR